MDRTRLCKIVLSTLVYGIQGSYSTLSFTMELIQKTREQPTTRQLVKLSIEHHLAVRIH